MKYLCLVQSFKTLYNLYENSPYFVLWNVYFLFEVFLDFLEEVSIICILHDDAIFNLRINQVNLP